MAVDAGYENVLVGDWLDVVQNLDEQFDAIYFDTFCFDGRPDWGIFTAHHVDRLLKPGGIFSYFNSGAAHTQGVAGLTLGADPLVTAVSVVSAYENRPIPALIIRKQAKGHGTMSYIEGPTLNANAKVVILEDVVTTGASAMMAVNRLREVGYHVNHIFSLVDRQQGGREFYDREGIQFESIFTISDLQENMKNINHKNND